MKHPSTFMCMVLLTLFAATAYTQNRLSTKPLLFAGFPATVNCSEAQLNSLFAMTKGETASLSLANNLSLTGPVTINQIIYSNLQTIIIQLPAFKNTLFSISKQTDIVNKPVYVGRILNPSYADGFELKRTADGNYQLIKTDTEKIFVHCNL